MHQARALAALIAIAAITLVGSPVQATPQQATVITAMAAAKANPTAPYGNATTQRIARKLRATNRGGWLAVTLNINGYGGPRKAEIVRIPAGHGKRYVGIIHVKPSKAKKVRRALSDVWVARRGGQFVVPLRSRYVTDGCGSRKCHRTAKWAKKRLGARWKVR